MFIIIGLTLLFLFLIHIYLIVPLRLISYYKRQGIKHIYFVPVIGIWYYYYTGYWRHGDSMHFIKKFLKENPEAPLILSNLGSKIYFILFKPDYLQAFLITNIEKTSVLQKNLISPLLGETNIFFSTGEEWKARRKIMSQGFTFGNIQKMTNPLEKIVDKHFQKIQTEILELGENKSDLMMVINDILGEFLTLHLFGLKFSGKTYQNSSLWMYQANLLDRLLERSSNLFYILLGPAIFNKIPFGKQGQLGRDIKMFKQALRSEILKQKEEILKAPSDINNQSLIERLFLSDQNMIYEDEYITTTLGGWDTTGALNHLLIVFSQHPDKLEKLQEEIRKTFPKDTALTLDLLNSCNYLDAAIKEGFRYFHGANLISPKLLESDGQFLDYKFLAKSIIQLCPYAGFHDPVVFENPEEYLPERWLGQRNYPQFSYIPFSMGPRNCIGQNLGVMQLKLLIVKIIGYFDFKPIIPPNTKLIYNVIYTYDKYVAFNLKNRIETEKEPKKEK